MSLSKCSRDSPVHEVGFDFLTSEAAAETGELFSARVCAKDWPQNVPRHAEPMIAAMATSLAGGCYYIGRRVAVGDVFPLARCAAFDESVPCPAAPLALVKCRTLRLVGSQSPMACINLIVPGISQSSTRTP